MNNVGQIGTPIKPPQFASQIAEIMKIIEQMREKLCFVTIKNMQEKPEATLRDGHINGELEMVRNELKELCDSINY